MGRDPRDWRRALIRVVFPRRPLPAGLSEAFAALDLCPARPVLILVGGAAGLATAIAAALGPLFERLAPCLDRLGAVVIDGGTAVGVMALMGEARRRSDARFPLLGIAPRGRVLGLDRFAGDSSGTLHGSEDAAEWRDPALAVAQPGAKSAPGDDMARLDPNHTHFILVPGDRWGAESPWISASAEYLAAGMGTLMLVAGGGEVTRLDVLHRLRGGGRILVLASSGGTADRLAEWRRAGGDEDTDLVPGADPERIEVLDLAAAPACLPAILERALGH